MDILLTHGYYIAEDAHEQQIMKPYPPLGLLYIASYLKAQGFAVDLFDTTFSTLAEFEAYLQAARPPLVGLYVNMMTKRHVLRMLPMIQAVGARIILGGPEPVNYAAEYLDHGADIIVDGEGEAALAELIPALQTEADLGDIAGILYRDETGRIQRTPARPFLKNLSDLPWPDRDAIAMDRYLETWKTHHGESSVSLITARGCPFTCTWCSHSVYGRSHRRRDPADVVAEVEWIKTTYDPDQLWYADDVFTIHRRWFLEFAALLREKALIIPFECISRPDRLDEEVVAALAATGCRRLWLGAESGSQRVLDAMQRRTDVSDVQAKTKLLQAAGIEVGMFIMLGYDGETEADIIATADHLKAAGPDLFLTTVAYPIKGTVYFDAVADRVSPTAAWENSTDRDYRVAGRYSRRYYAHADRWLVSSVRLHQAWHGGRRDWPALARLAFNSLRGRLGMRLTRHERETPADPGGRGWRAAERAADAW